MTSPPESNPTAGPPRPNFLDEHVLVVSGTEFYCSLHLARAGTGQLPVMKERPLVERQLAFIDAHRPQVIVELGIQAGGSTALLAAAARPKKLVAFELAPDRVDALDRFVADAGLDAVVRAHYGVDQADRRTVARLLDEELGDDPIDLVIDDASHRYEQTLASFELLFGRLRPGGTYIVEDWNGVHLVGDVLADAAADASDPAHHRAMAGIIERLEQEVTEPAPPSLTQLALELVVARASGGDVIRSVLVEDDWITVTRGADPLPSGPFRLADHVRDHERLLARHPSR